MQVGVSEPSPSQTITFTLAEPTTIFGIWIGDMFDGMLATTYTLSTGSEGSFFSASGKFDTTPYSGTVTTTVPDSPSESFTAGDGIYNFFGVITDTTFTSVTLQVASSGSSKDNFAFDDVTVGVIPEPATGSLLLLGLGVLVTISRRR